MVLSNDRSVTGEDRRDDSIGETGGSRQAIMNDCSPMLHRIILGLSDDSRSCADSGQSVSFDSGHRRKLQMPQATTEAIA
jgi:hypothetical protein